MAEQNYSRKKSSGKLQKVQLEFAWHIHRVRSYNNLEMIYSTRKVVYICKYSATLYKRPWPPQIVMSSGWRVSLEPAGGKGGCGLVSCQRFSVCGAQVLLVLPTPFCFLRMRPFLSVQILPPLG